METSGEDPDVRSDPDVDDDASNRPKEYFMPKRQRTELASYGEQWNIVSGPSWGDSPAAMLHATLPSGSVPPFIKDPASVMVPEVVQQSHVVTKASRQTTFPESLVCRGTAEEGEEEEEEAGREVIDSHTNHDNNSITSPTTDNTTNNNNDDQTQQTKKRKKRRESTSPLESGTWPLRFEALKAFRASFGHCRVPQRYKSDPMLGVWVGHLRTRKRQGKLNPLKVELLNSIGFEWEVRKNRWEEKYEQLVQFKERFGHCRVPIGWEENPALANWTHEMRRKRKRGSLSPELEAKLQQLDFEWQLMEQSTWDDGFEELKRYKEKFHTCCVPRNYGKDFKLGHWVHNMRYKYKKGTLKPEQIALLESLGFQWSVRKQKELRVEEEPPIIEPALENEATPTTEQTSTPMPTSHSPPLPPSSPLHHLTSPPLSSSQLSFSNLQQQQHHAFLSSDSLTDTTTDPSSSHMSLFETSLPGPPLSHPEQQQLEAAGEDGGLHHLQHDQRTAPCDFMQATEGDNLPGHHHAQEYDETELRPDTERVAVTQE